MSLVALYLPRRVHTEPLVMFVMTDSRNFSQSVSQAESDALFLAQQPQYALETSEATAAVESAPAAWHNTLLEPLPPPASGTPTTAHVHLSQRAPHRHRHPPAVLLDLW